MLITPLGNNVFELEYREFSLIYTGEMTRDLQQVQGIDIVKFSVNAIDRLILNLVSPCKLRLRCSHSDGAHEGILMSVRVDLLKDS